jgi:hypothetical protein
MATLKIKDSDIGDDLELRRIAEALKVDAKPEQVTAGWRIWDANKGSGELSLEAGLLEVDGAEHPVIGVRYQGDIVQYLTGKSGKGFPVKAAGPEDKYTPGPPVTITED